jgi:acetylornithine deacetylase/succinyl-diaminopimelate desuccinylase-like protein
MLFKLPLTCLLTAAAFAGTLDNANRQLSRDIFRQLIEINTTDSAGSTTTAAEAMRKRLLDAGLPAADVVVTGPNARKGNMVARLRGTGKGKPILIIAHLDVVEAKRSDWTTDPFQFIEKDGYFYGRGTQDMKDSDAIAVTTLIRYLHEGYKPNRDIILALTADEEGGTFNGVEWLLEHHRELLDAEYVLNPDAGGVMTDKGKPIDIEVEATEKLYADFQLTAANPGGHSSLPTPDNAIYEIADALSRLEKAPFGFELNNVTRAWFAQVASSEKPEVAADIKAMLKTPPDAAAIERLSRNPRFNSTMRTTCVATRLSGGHADNALPQTAQALVNCRILPGHSPEEVRQQLVNVFADGKIKVKFKDPATAEYLDKAPNKMAFLPPPPRPDVMNPLRAIAAQMWPGAPVIPEMETGASDSIYTIAAGLPSYGINGVAIDADDIRAHGQDERLRVESFYAGVEFYYKFLKALTLTEPLP